MADMNEPKVNFLQELCFPADYEDDQIPWLSWPEGGEASAHRFDLGLCKDCGVSSLSAWRGHGGRPKELCLARTTLGRDWAMAFHDGRAIDPTGKILVYVLPELAETMLQRSAWPRRVAWVQIVEHPTKHVKCVLFLSGYPGKSWVEERA